MRSGCSPLGLERTVWQLGQTSLNRPYRLQMPRWSRILRDWLASNASSMSCPSSKDTLPAIVPASCSAPSVKSWRLARGHCNNWPVLGNECRPDLPGLTNTGGIVELLKWTAVAGPWGTQHET